MQHGFMVISIESITCGEIKKKRKTLNKRPIILGNVRLIHKRPRHSLETSIVFYVERLKQSLETFTHQMPFSFE